MQKKWLKPLLVGVLALTLCLFAVSAMTAPPQENLEENRMRLLSFLLQKRLTIQHYSHKQLDDAFSKDAFEIYLKQLDSQKRFLLAEDVKKLRAFSLHIDDEMEKGVFNLPMISREIMEKRVETVQLLVEGILSEDIDLLKEGSLETDPDKLDYCKDEAALKARWYKIVRLSLASRYLNLEEEKEEAGDKTELLHTAKQKLAKTYNTLFQRMKEESSQDYNDRYFNVVARTFDPHTSYLTPAQTEEFDIQMRGSLEGIGATLREEDGYIKVVRIIPGSASYRQGQLEAEDIILAVAEGNGDPVEIIDTRIRDAVRLIRGRKGSEVRLTVKKPEGRRLIIPIIRDVVQIEETFARSTVVTDEQGRRFGYLKIPSFYRDFERSTLFGQGRNVTDDVRSELRKLKKEKISGLVLDLRNNGGGALQDAVSVTGLFIERGPVVQIKSSDGRKRILGDTDGSVEYDGEVVVLVNKFSASASEILAGAFQDYGRGIVIGGDHTHGKGTVQSKINLDRDLRMPDLKKYLPLGALKLTVQKFYRISGESTQFRGIVPDIILPDRLEFLESGEQYLDHSLPWDRVQATDYRKWPDAPEVSLEELRANSLVRTGADEEFISIAKEAQEAKQRWEKTLQPLSLTALRDQRQEILDKAKDQEEPDETEELLSSEEVLKDPYAREALAVLVDILSANGRLARDSVVQ